MKKPSRSTSASPTSWSSASRWYDTIVGEKGHFYHRELIIPNTLRLLDLHSNDRLLDLGCGQGVFARHLPKQVAYIGVDIASPLLRKAKQYLPTHTFIQADLTKPWPELPTCTHAVCLLALQNMETPEMVFSELSKVLVPKGRAVFVLNHPCFRIPRQTQWGLDEATKRQMRQVFSYMSHQKIPITTHPGESSEATWSFHFPLSYYSTLLQKSGFVIEVIEEWCSPKESTGSAARAENRARKEFPLFMALSVINQPFGLY